MRRIKPKPSWIAKKAKRGFRGYPTATVAMYGPTNLLATKLAVAIFLSESDEPHILKRWFSESADIRGDEEVRKEITEFLRRHEVLSVSAVDRIIGCPHEEGVDYPSNESCPQCPYWAGRDRFTHQRIH